MGNNPINAAEAAYSDKVEALIEAIIQDIRNGIQSGMSDQEIVCDLRDNKHRSQTIIATAMKEMGWDDRMIAKAFFGPKADSIPDTSSS